MSDKAAYVRAAQRYGPSLDRYARQYGLSGYQLLLKLGKGESGFNQGAVSGANARGATQFIPSTRQSFIKQYGVDPWRDVDSAVHAAAIYLRKSGLAAYNPGMPSYTKYILGQNVGGAGKQAPGASLGTSTTTTTTTPPSVHTDKLAALRDALLEGGKNPLISAAHRVSSGAYDTQVPGKTTTSTDYGLGAGGGGKNGKLVGKPIDRPGVKTGAAILAFARQVAGVYGSPITLGTGTLHSRMTTSGNVSAHWSGNALDLPAVGRKLIAMGQAALIAAGMSPAKARQQRGGLYNVGGKQIIFNINDPARGGDHTNHLHIGLRG